MTAAGRVLVTAQTELQANAKSRRWKCGHVRLYKRITDVRYSSPFFSLLTWKQRQILPVVVTQRFKNVILDMTLGTLRLPSESPLSQRNARVALGEYARMECQERSSKQGASF